jgi:hypothetical protein
VLDGKIPQASGMQLVDRMDRQVTINIVYKHAATNVS